MVQAKGMLATAAILRNLANSCYSPEAAATTTIGNAEGTVTAIAVDSRTITTTGHNPGCSPSLGLLGSNSAIVLDNPGHDSLIHCFVDHLSFHTADTDLASVGRLAFLVDSVMEHAVIDPHLDSVRDEQSDLAARKLDSLIDRCSSHFHPSFASLIGRPSQV